MPTKRTTKAKRSPKARLKVTRIDNPRGDIYPPWPDPDQSIRSPVWCTYAHSTGTRIAIWPTPEAEGTSPVADLAVPASKKPAQVVAEWLKENVKK